LLTAADFATPTAQLHAPSYGTSRSALLNRLFEPFLLGLVFAIVDLDRIDPQNILQSVPGTGPVLGGHGLLELLVRILDLLILRLA